MFNQSSFDVLKNVLNRILRKPFYQISFLTQKFRDGMILINIISFNGIPTILHIILKNPYTPLHHYEQHHLKRRSPFH